MRRLAWRRERAKRRQLFCVKVALLFLRGVCSKLTASEYDETTWSARTWMAFVTQRLSVAAQLSMAQEAAEALGLSVAADPRAQ